MDWHGLILMFRIVWIVYILHTVNCERAGVTQCSSQTYGSTGLGGSTGGSGGSYLMQDESFMFACCGVIQSVKMDGSSGTMDVQVWRQTAADTFTLISKAALTAADFSGSGTVTGTVTYGARVSFQEGDMLGWHASGVLVKRAAANVYLNRYSSSQAGSTSGDTHAWNSDDVQSNFRYGIQAVTAPSTSPYFSNLPATFRYADTDVTVSGLTITTLTYSDVDPDDVSGLTVTMSPDWSDYFELTTTNVVKTKRPLTPGTYIPFFRVEESHCGVSLTSTVTIIVTDSAPSITNLPAAATIHEDDLDETLLYTITTSDPTNQAIWCKHDWTIGTSGAAKPFIVKMLSTTPGDSRAGIYLIEWPGLDYDTIATFYDLSITCKDTFGNSVTGSFYVNVVKNQAPIITNLGNSVEIDAEAVRIGDTIFTVSSSDADGDQVTYTYTCTPSTNSDGNCPFALYDSGQVMVTSNLYLWNTFTYTLTVTANDLRDSSTARDLVIYVINYNVDPVINNLNAVTLTVEENSALSKSLYQVSTTDADLETGHTIAHYMTINDDQAYALFQLSSAGLFSTHSTNNINYDILTTTSFTVTVYANDGKEQVSGTFTIAVTDQNEAVSFTQPAYSTTTTEGAAGAAFPNAYIAVVDPDVTDTHTYTMSCGAYDSYFSLNPTTAIVTYAQNYDLDAGTLPTAITCTLIVNDGASNNATADLGLYITFDNDNTPTFNPTSYHVNVWSNAPKGQLIIKVTATDEDAGSDGDITYTLTQTSLGGTYLMIDTDGSIHANQVLTPLASAGTKTVVATASDGTNSGTANVVITFIDATIDPFVVDDRDRTFFNDTRNVAWFTLVMLTIATCIFVILWLLLRWYMALTRPLCEDWFRVPERRRKVDRRPRHYGRQQKPTFRHVHATEILRPEVATPEPVEDTIAALSNRRGSRDSNVYGRVTVSQVTMREEEEERGPNSWMEGYTSPTNQSTAPTRSVAEQKVKDKDYMRLKGQSRRRSSDTLTVSGSAGDLRQVNPSTVPWDNTDIQLNGNHRNTLDDDFRSERLSIARVTPSPVPLNQW